MGAAIDEAVRALAAGGLVCTPTESTYGLAVDLRRPLALARLVALKGGRPASSPFPVIAPSLESARALARVWPDAAGRLAERHWPGPLTIVVPGRADLPPEVLGPDGTVGVRVSSHPIAAALVAALGAPVTATSANRSGGRPATTVQEAIAALGDTLAFDPAGVLLDRFATGPPVYPAGVLLDRFATGLPVYLDGGICAGQPSTVVAVDEAGALRLLRAGPIDLGLELAPPPV